MVMNSRSPVHCQGYFPVKTSPLPVKSVDFSANATSVLNFTYIYHTVFNLILSPFIRNPEYVMKHSDDPYNFVKLFIV